MQQHRIRKYRASDRDRVRHISYLTGHMGESIAWCWRDEKSFADLFTSQYIDCEPESSFVVEAGDDVVGYLLGRKRVRDIETGSAALHQAITRGLILRPGTAGFFWRAGLDVLLSRGLPPADLADPRWPASLHINLLPQARGHGLGRTLMHTFFEYLADSRVPGVHLGGFAENTEAVAFFEHMGFEPYGEPYLVPGFRSRSGEHMHRQVMVRAIP